MYLSNNENMYKDEMNKCLRQLYKAKDLPNTGKKLSITDDTIKITLESLQLLLFEVTGTIE